MKKIINLGLCIFLIVFLAACSETESKEEEPVANQEEEFNENEDQDNWEDQEEEPEEEPEEEESDYGEYTKAYNEILLDTEEIVLTLKEIKKQDGNRMNRGYYLLFDVENKLSEDIIVKSVHEVADGVMIEDDVYFIGTILANEKKEMQMEIITYTDRVLEIKDLLELVIVVSEEEKVTELNRYELTIQMPEEEKKFAANIEEKEEFSNPETGEFRKIFDDLIYDSEEFSVVLKRIERIAYYDLGEREEYRIYVEVENKLDEEISFTYIDSVADGEKIHAVVRDRVNAKRKVNSLIYIEDQFGEELPVIEDYLEINLAVFIGEDSATAETHIIRIDFDFDL